MTLKEAIALLEQTIKRLQADKDRWYRKRKRMSDNDNEKWKAIHQLEDELAALYIVQYYMKEKANGSSTTTV